MSSEGFESWAVVELMGHVRMAGRVTEEERFGAKLGRVDVPSGRKVCCPDCGGFGNGPDVANGPEIDQEKCPTCEGNGQVDGFTTVYFSGASLYRLTPTTEEIARQVARGSQPEPVHRWELPKPEQAPQILDGDDRDYRSDTPDDAYDLGEAHADGGRLASNPYRVDSLKWEQYNEGYASAKHAADGGNGSEEDDP